MDDHIKVNCPNCEKTIKAPRAAAGKRGKCPHCHTSIYVPTPREEIEEIPLAPLAAGAEERLRREALDVEAALRRERETPSGGASEKVAAGPAKAAVRDSSEADTPTTSLQDTIVDYLVAMQSSSLRAAAAIVEQLKRSRHQAKSKIQQLMVDTVRPPRMENLPEGLYRGFLKKLLDQLE